MSYIQTDILLKTMLEAAIADLRANDYVVDDISAGFSAGDISEAEYGDKERKRFKEWFLSNNIGVFMQQRIDTPTFPCIVIVDSGDQEMENRAALSDDRGYPEDFDPKNIETTPDYVYAPFTPSNYDAASGTVTFPKGVTNEALFPGMFLVSRTGSAYQVRKLVGKNAFQIKPGVRVDLTNCYVTPMSALWNLQREQTFLRHSYSLVCMASSDPVYAQWLHAIVVYCLGRYKEVWLEARGFEISTFGSSPLQKAPRYDPENVWFKSVSLTGQVELSWIKYVAPRLAGVKGGIKICDALVTPENYKEQVLAQGWRLSKDPDFGEENS
jgi:hypothetical protein